MFGFLGGVFSSSSDFGTPVHEDCDNIEYTPLGNGMVAMDDPADEFTGIVPMSSLPVDIQDAINDATP